MFIKIYGVILVTLCNTTYQNTSDNHENIQNPNSISPEYHVYFFSEVMITFPEGCKRHFHFGCGFLSPHSRHLQGSSQQFHLRISPCPALWHWSCRPLAVQRSKFPQLTYGRWTLVPNQQCTKCGVQYHSGGFFGYQWLGYEMIRNHRWISIGILRPKMPNLSIFHDQHLQAIHVQAAWGARPHRCTVLDLLRCQITWITGFWYIILLMWDISCVSSWPKLSETSLNSVYRGNGLFITTSLQPIDVCI